MNIENVVIDQAAHIEIVRTLSEKLRAYYIFPEVAEEICVSLEKHLEDGDYTDIDEGEFLALALTMHMQKISRDEHLWVRWHPETLPVHEGSLLQNQEWVDEWRQKAKMDNYGIHEVKRLPGNVGYIDLRYFYRTSLGSGDTVVAAMNFLANMDVLIVDLRKCMGGNPSMVAMISSYFFEEESVHLNGLYWREDDVTEQYWTLPYIPGKRLDEKPVYILISKDTFSAGEEFVYNLQTQQRATLVGEPTGGGAHPGSAYRIHPHFEAFIPNGRAINPITNDNWEGSGVQPDISVSADQALNVAYRMALTSIIENIQQPTSRPFKLLLEEAQAALEDIEDL